MTTIGDEQDFYDAKSFDSEYEFKESGSGNA